MRQQSGQTGLLITLFILVLGLTGFTVYLYIQQGASTETLTKKVDDQDRSLRKAKDTIDELSQKVSSQKDAISYQEQTISTLKNDSTAMKASLAQIQSGVNDSVKAVKDDVASLKKDSAQRAEPLLASLSKTEERLNDLSEQIKKLQTPALPPTVTPVIDVKMDTTVKNPTKANDKKKADVKK